MKTFFVLLMLSCVAVGCADSASPTLAPDVTAAQRASAAASMGLTFPPETRFLLYHRLSEASPGLPTPDDAVWLKIELPAPALSAFVSQNALSSADSTGSARTVHDDPSWAPWRPSQVRRYRTTQGTTPNAAILSVLIDDDDASSKVVYLQWSEM